MELRFRDVHEERLTHRLEAFSDIVLGFSLAQLSLNFVIPPHPQLIYLVPTAPITFAFTFFVVAMTWFVHHRLFEYFFVPRPSTILLNFVTLGCVVWLVYQLQVYGRFTLTADSVFAATSYIVTFAVAWSMLGALYGLCVKIRWAGLDTAERRDGLSSTGRILSVGIGTIATVILLRIAHLMPEYAFWLIPVWAVLWRAAAPRLLRGLPT